MRHLLAAILLLATTARGETRIIGGTPVAPGEWPQIVPLLVEGSRCTATIVGPRVIVTAAHCASVGQGKGTISFEGVTHAATLFRSPLYPGKDHDLAAGILPAELDVAPLTVGGVTKTGLVVEMLGFGCTNPGGTDVSDGVLRIAGSSIVDLVGFDFVTRLAGGGALCFGDSGGPAVVDTDDGVFVLGIASKGNITDTSYFSRLDSADSRNFLRSLASQQAVEICGINAECYALSARRR